MSRHEFSFFFKSVETWDRHTPQVFFFDFLGKTRDRACHTTIMPSKISLGKSRYGEGKRREEHEDQCHGFYLDALSLILIPGKTPGSAAACCCCWVENRTQHRPGARQLRPAAGGATVSASASSPSSPSLSLTVDGGS
jgi:hypothetical protein